MLTPDIRGHRQISLGHTHQCAIGIAFGSPLTPNAVTDRDAIEQFIGSALQNAESPSSQFTIGDMLLFVVDFLAAANIFFDDRLAECMRVVRLLQENWKTQQSPVRALISAAIFAMIGRDRIAHSVDFDLTVFPGWLELIGGIEKRFQLPASMANALSTCCRLWLLQRPDTVAWLKVIRGVCRVDVEGHALRVISTAVRLSNPAELRSALTHQSVFVSAHPLSSLVQTSLVRSSFSPLELSLVVEHFPGCAFSQRASELLAADNLAAKDLFLLAQLVVGKSEQKALSRSLSHALHDFVRRASKDDRLWPESKEDPILLLLASGVLPRVDTKVVLLCLAHCLMYRGFPSAFKAAIESMNKDEDDDDVWRPVLRQWFQRAHSSPEPVATSFQNLDAVLSGSARQRDVMANECERAVLSFGPADPLQAIRAVSRLDAAGPYIVQFLRAQSSGWQELPIAFFVEAFTVLLPEHKKQYAAIYDLVSR